MLNPFPELLWLSIMVPFILRLTLGGVFLFEGYKRLVIKRDQFLSLFKERWTQKGGALLWIFGVLEILIGGLFIVGLYTQIAALFAIIIVLAAVFVRHGSLFLVRGKMVQLFIFVISLSLLLSGAGPFAFDLPL